MTKKTTNSKTVFIAMQGTKAIGLEDAYGLSSELDEALANAADIDSLDDVTLYEVKIVAKYSVSAAQKYKLTKMR